MGNPEEKTLTVYGKHQFVVMADDHGLADEVAWIRLSRFGWTPCQAEEEASLRAYMVNIIEDESAGEKVSLPSGFGVLASMGGKIIGVVTEEGLIRRLEYRGDGSGADVPGQPRMSLFSLAADEKFESAEFKRELWDYWAMGRPLDM